jgi:hypothetical protein
MDSADKLNRSTWLSTLFVVLVFFLYFFFFVDLFELLWLSIFIIIWPLLLTLLVLAILDGIKLPCYHWRSKGPVTLLPLGFLVGALTLLYFVDLTPPRLTLDFWLNHGARMEVVERARAERDWDGDIEALPVGIPLRLDRGDRAELQDDGESFKLLFYTYRGILGNFAGFVYSSEDAPPQSGDFEGHFFIVEKWQDHWYYVAAH